MKNILSSDIFEKMVIHGNSPYRELYAPYGEPFGGTGTNPTEYGYTGEWTDQNDLVYLRARYYDPATGNFISQDPLELVNRYGYTSGNPINLADLNGLFGERNTPNNSCSILTHPYARDCSCYYSYLDDPNIITYDVNRDTPYKRCVRGITPKCNSQMGPNCNPNQSEILSSVVIRYKVQLPGNETRTYHHWLGVIGQGPEGEVGIWTHGHGTMNQIGETINTGFLEIEGAYGTLDVPIDQNLEILSSNATRGQSMERGARFIELPEAHTIGRVAQTITQQGQFGNLPNQTITRVFDPGENPASLRDFVQADRPGTQELKYISGISWLALGLMYSQEMKHSDLCTIQEPIYAVGQIGNISNGFATAPPLLPWGAQTDLWSSNKDSGGGIFLDGILIGNGWARVYLESPRGGVEPYFGFGFNIIE